MEKNLIVEGSGTGVMVRLVSVPASYLLHLGGASF
jgi:hypothetical protein